LRNPAIRSEGPLVCARVPATGTAIAGPIALFIPAFFVPSVIALDYRISISL
jgi:hypothetical protein